MCATGKQPHALNKPVLFLQCLVAASVFCFVIGGGHEMFIAITIQETCIVLFFVIIYLVTLQHLLVCIHWPLLVSVHLRNFHVSFAPDPKS